MSDLIDSRPPSPSYDERGGAGAIGGGAGGGGYEGSNSAINGAMQLATLTGAGVNYGATCVFFLTTVLLLIFFFLSFLTAKFLHETEQMEVQREFVGIIIGHKGEMIKRMQADTGARIQFVNDAVAAPVRTLTLSGDENA